MSLSASALAVAPVPRERTPISTLDDTLPTIALDGGRRAPSEAGLPRSHFSERRFEAQMRIDLGRDPPGQLTEVLEGTVLLVRILPDGRRQVLEVLGPGSLVGLEPEERHAVFAETRTRVRIRIHDTHRNAGPLKERYAAQMKSRLAALHELTLSMGRRTSVERIAGFLIKLAGLQADALAGEVPPRPRMVPLVLSQTDIADHLGLRPETVCRVLAKLKRDRVIALPAHSRLDVLDAAALGRLAGQPLRAAPDAAMLRGAETNP